MRLINALLAAALTAAPTAVLAGDPGAAPADAVVTAPTTASAPSSGLVFSLQAGVSVAPEYFGSKDYTAGPALGFRFHSLTLGNGRSFGSADPWEPATGFGLRGSFRYIGERDASDHADLAGMKDVDAALELGMGVGYTARNFSIHADARRGFGGHEDWVGELGIDAIARPTDRLRVTFGPRMFWGGDDYAATYFGVTAAEATASRPAFDADGGVLSAGLALGATYKLSDNWGVEGTVAWNRYLNDAQDSPIVKAGSEDEWTLRVGLTRVIRLGGN